MSRQRFRRVDWEAEFQQTMRDHHLKRGLPWPPNPKPSEDELKAARAYIDFTNRRAYRKYGEGPEKRGHRRRRRSLRAACAQIDAEDGLL